MGRSNNSSNGALISSSESGSGGGPVVVSSSPYLPNFPPGVGGGLGSYGNNGGYSGQQPPSPPVHPQQYINMGHLATAAAQAHYYETGNNNANCTPPNGMTPPGRVYSPMSHGSNSSNGSSSGLSYVSSTSGGGGGVGGSLTIAEAMTAAASSGANLKFEYEDFPQEPDGGPVKTTTWKDHVAVFNMDQVGVMCDVLLQEGDIDRLVDLLATVAKDFIGRSEKILRAQAHVAYHAAIDDPRKFPQVYKILETNSFSSQYHAGLQKLWFSAHYKEAEITRGRPLGAVDKYRIRRKFPLPRTIWDGEETIYCFKERSRNALRQSFMHEKYPNLEEKKKLSKETGLTMVQVGNWFKNKRQREKEKMQGKAIAKRPKSYGPPSGLAPVMAPDLLGVMMLNPVGVSQPHLHHHHHHHQSHLSPMSPEDLEAAIRRAKYEESRLKNYMEESSMYSQSIPSQAQSPSHFQSYLHHHHPHLGNSPNNNPARCVSQKPDLVSPSAPSNNQQASPPRLNTSGGGGGGLIVVPSPATPHHEESAGNPDNSSPPPHPSGESAELYRPRSPASSGARCGTDFVPLSYLHSSPSAHHHQHQHSLYSPHHHHSHHGHHPSVAVSGYDNGIAPLIHPHA